MCPFQRYRRMRARLRPKKNMLSKKSGILILLSAFLLPFSANGETLCALGPAASSYNAYTDQRPSSDAMELARQVNGALAPVCSPNCPTLALFRNSTATNAMAIAGSGGAKIVYAPQFFTVVYERYGDGAIMAILAHLVGHAIETTASAAWMRKGWTPELRADAWAGCALAKANLSSRSLNAALTAVRMYPSPAHPDWLLRVPALRLGYTHCGGDLSKFESQVRRSGPN